MDSIPSNEIFQAPRAVEYIEDALKSGKISGDHQYTKKCQTWLKQWAKSNALLTSSCTHSLELAAQVAEVGPDDEVILPSFTFPSTANAFALRGAKLIFIDIRPDTLNINEKLIEEAITSKTKVISPVHYAGVSCEMDSILELARLKNLIVIEDSAQCLMSRYKGEPAGVSADMSCFSFHETKNYTSGEGGAFLTRNQELLERAEIIREKGTNRSAFLRGQVDKYSWRDVGSSYLMSDLNAALLFSQLESADEILSKRLNLWNQYYNGLQSLALKELIQLPHVPQDCEHNAHIFYLLTRSEEARNGLLSSLRASGIGATSHYVPLHSTLPGQKWGRFHGKDEYTTTFSNRIIRLPLYPSLTHEQTDFVMERISQYFEKEEQ